MVEDSFQKLFAANEIDDDDNVSKPDSDASFSLADEHPEAEDEGYMDDFQNTLENLLTTTNEKQEEVGRVSKKRDLLVRHVESEGLDPRIVQAEIDKLETVKVRGSHPPLPLKNWLSSGLSDHHLEVLNSMGCQKPFAVQQIAIPALNQGRDALVIAETGSGKTLSYCIPVIRRTTTEKQRPGQHKGPYAVVVVCSRELADQVHNLLRNLTAKSGIVLRVAHGGNDVGHDMAEIATSCDILIGCPGRIVDVCTKRKGSNFFSRTALIVFDEADRLFDEGFCPQIEKIFEKLAGSAQKAMFSATMPGFIAKSAKKFLHNALTIYAGSRLGISPMLQQHVEVFEKEDDRFFRLLQILGEFVNQQLKVLIFVEKRNDLEELYMSLEMHGHKSVTIYADMDSVDRGYAMDEFLNPDENDPTYILIATGLAARGLDIPNLTLVINYTAPPCLEEYVHRVGRTARGGSAGTSRTFLLKPYENKHALYLLQVLQDSPHDDSAINELRAIAKEICGDKEMILWTPQDSYRSYAGHGYSFDQEERKKANKRRKMHQKETARALGMGGGPITPAVEPGKEGVLTIIEDETKQRRQAPVVSSIAKTTGKEIVLKSGDAKARAMAIAAAINEAKELESNKLEHSVSIPINDYSLRVRRAATDRTLLAELFDDTSIEVSFSGEFIKGPAAPEKKLHIVLKSLSKQALAVAEKKIVALVQHESKFDPV